jgi:anti-sigma regulatory factor (Ser/Thr protein kinase)
VGRPEVHAQHESGCAWQRPDDTHEQASRDRATAQSLREYLQGAEADDARPVEQAWQVREARACARDVAREAAVDDDRRDALVLVVSELVGNAVRHGRSPVAYDLHVDDDDLVFTVTDGDPTPPGPGSCCDPDPDAEGGRGLFLVGQLTRCWGWKPAGDGKQVWARV